MSNNEPKPARPQSLAELQKQLDAAVAKTTSEVETLAAHVNDVVNQFNNLHQMVLRLRDDLAKLTHRYEARFGGERPSCPKCQSAIMNPRSKTCAKCGVAL